MLPDLPGTLIALLAFALVALAPGWAIGYWLNLLSFRARFITYKLALSLALSLAVSPMLLVLIVRYTNLRIGAGAMLTLDLLAIVAIAHAMRSRRVRIVRSPRIVAARRRWIRITALVAIIWMLITLVMLLDLRIGNRLYMSVPWMDHTKRASWIDAIVRTGVPPDNPSTYPSHPLKLFYYYGWYVWAATAQTLTGGIGSVRPLQTLIAAVVWSGWAFIGSLVLAVQYIGGAVRRRLRACWSIACMLLLVTGLDLIPGLMRFFAFLSEPNNDGAPRTTEWWNEQVTGFVDMMLWVPHHVAGLVAGILALSVLRSMHSNDTANLSARRSSHAFLVERIVMAIALASLSTLSLYIAIPLGAFLVVYAIVCLSRRRRSEAGTLIGVAVGAGIIASPYLYDLLTAPGATSGMVLSIREFSPVALFLRSRNISPVLIGLANLLLLPINYFMEFGFYFLAGLMYWLWRRGQRRAVDRFACGLFWASLIVATFLRSTIYGNDLGWRSIAWAQVVLLVWATEPASAMWSAIFGTRATSPQADALVERFPRTISLMLLLLVIGLGSTLYDLFLLRCSFSRWPVKAIEPPRALAVRQAYEWIDRHVPADAVVQHNPNVRVDLYAAHYGNRQAVASDTGVVLAQSMTPKEFTKLINRIYEQFMLPRSPEKVKQVANELHIDYLVAKDTDDDWPRKTSWFWTQRAVYENPYVRIIAVKDLATK